MNLKIKGKNAVVTGGSKGIGKSIALDLIEEGVNVTVISRSDIDFDAKHIKCDLMKEIPDISDLDVDILINNIGGNYGIRRSHSTPEEWKDMYKFNLGITLEINEQVIPHMRKQKWGRIVNMSSFSSTGSGGSTDSYAAIKSALNIYTVKLAKYLAEDGIVVSAVSPSGVIFKDNGWDRFKQRDFDGFNAYIDEFMPIGRLGVPEDISPIVLFLCSDLARFCVGTIIQATGGAR